MSQPCHPPLVSSRCPSGSPDSAAASPSSTRSLSSARALWLLTLPGEQPSTAAACPNEAAYGPDHPHVATTLTNLGSVQYELGDLDDARATLQRALAIFQTAYGPDHPDVAKTLGNLCVVQRQMRTE
jgi:Tetratricopeptide repeat